MSKKQLRGHLQNFALALLTVSALFLLTRLPVLRGIQWTDRMGGFLASRPAAGAAETGGIPAAMLPSVQLLVTEDSEYGRYVRLNVTAGDPVLQSSVLPLFQEALGSAAEPALTAQDTLRDALAQPGLYLDLTTSTDLPLAAAEPLLGEDSGLELRIRAAALTAGEEGFASLYLLEPGGDIYRCETALPASAVQAVCESFPPNGGRFAYESNYASLEPYTVLAAQTPALPPLTSELPAGYSAYNLLTALDFNAHTLSRYTESGGAEVVEESPRTLRVSPDGTVSFTSRGESGSPLYRAAGENPGLREHLAAAWRLIAALSEGTGASPLHLRSVRETEAGYTLSFRYESEGVPIFFPDEGDALTVVFSGGQVVSFTYRCRVYTPQETQEEMGLLPATMAQAMAAIYPNASLLIGYEDNGVGPLAAQWLAG